MARLGRFKRRPTLYIGGVLTGLLMLAGCDFRHEVADVHPAGEFVEVCESQIRQLELHRDGGAENLRIFGLISSLEKIAELEWSPRTAYVSLQLEHATQLKSRLERGIDLGRTQAQLERKIKLTDAHIERAMVENLRDGKPLRGENTAKLEGEREEIRSQILALVMDGAIDEDDERKRLNEAYRKAIIEIAGWIDEANSWRRIEGGE